MAEDHRRSVGRQIRALRRGKGWSQRDLAHHIRAEKVDAQLVSKWERGIHEPKKHLQDLAEALGVDAGTILAGDKRQRKGSTPDVLGELDSAMELRELSAAVAQLRQEVAGLREGQAELLATVEQVRRAQGSRQEPQKRAGRRGTERAS